MERRLSAPAVRMHVIGLQAVRARTAPGKPSVTFAASARAGEQHCLVRAAEPAHWVPADRGPPDPARAANQNNDHQRGDHGQGER